MAGRSEIAGPGKPELKIYITSVVEKGYQRGSRELGFPTANLSHESFQGVFEKLGVYYGYARVDTEGPNKSDSAIHEMVMSVGVNPFYSNPTRSAEVHILHKYGHDFYGHTIRLVVLGYIRPEQNYDSTTALINDIKFDCKVAHNSLSRPGYSAYLLDPYLN